jgi:DNA-binding MarR family transcriptional regulator
MRNAHAIAVRDVPELETWQAGEPSAVSPSALFDLLHALQEVTDRLRKRWDRELRTGVPGMNAARASVIVHLARDGDAPQFRLARSVGVSQMTLSRLLDVLEQAHFVRREQVLADRRVHAVHLTTDGRKVLAAICARAREFAQQTLVETDQARIQALIAVLGAGSSSPGTGPHDKRVSVRPREKTWAFD